MNNDFVAEIHAWNIGIEASRQYYDRAMSKVIVRDWTQSQLRWIYDFAFAEARRGLLVDAARRRSAPNGSAA